MTSQPKENKMKKLLTLVALMTLVGCNTEPEQDTMVTPVYNSNSCMWTSYLSETMVVDSLYTGGRKYELNVYPRYPCTLR